MSKRIYILAFFSILTFLGQVAILASQNTAEESKADWPMWRRDARRSGSTTMPLPEKLHLQWVRRLAPPRPAWPVEQYKLQFDCSYEPIAMDRLLFVPSMVGDCVIAYEIDSGRERWRFYTDGPVRFAPLGRKGKLYFVSDDGYLYCLKAQNGSLLWKFRGGPSDRKVLGNERLISAWPPRGAPVIYDDTIYFAAGIWPFMGIFIHALDAETGQVVWTNSGSGSIYIQQQHNSPAFAGVAPQGYLAATKDKLLIPSRTTPACYNRKTGELIYYQLHNSSYGSYVGGYNVSVWKDWFFNNEIIYRLSDGKGIARSKAEVLSDNAVIGFNKTGELMGYTIQPEQSGAKGLWKTSVSPELDRIYLQAGGRLYGSGKDGLIASLKIPTSTTHKKAPSSSAGTTDANARINRSHPEKIADINGNVWSMLAAFGKLVVVTVEGEIYCFGKKEVEQKYYQLENDSVVPASNKWRKKAERILKLTNNPGGYALLLGLGSGDLLKELIRQSDLHIIALDPDVRKVRKFRREMDRLGLYGSRVTILAGDITSVELPPYMAELIVSQDIQAGGFKGDGKFIKRLFHSLRPYGGTACFELPRNQQNRFTRQVEGANLAAGRLSSGDGFVMLERVGKLPGSGEWTGQYADPANSVCSKDNLVRAPLGLLWFGDRSSFTDVLPRHGHGPPEQVIGGRLFIEGIDCISARDVYTGRILWKRHLENLGTHGVYYDDSYKPDPLDKTYNQLHIPGASARGTNFIATAENLYIIQDRHCLVMDAATGRDLKIINLPKSPDGQKSQWGYIGVYKNYLIATADYTEYAELTAPETSGKSEKNKKEKKQEKRRSYWNHYYDKIAGRRLVIMDRHTGRLLWQINANHCFLHNTIAVGNDKIFCLDKLPSAVEKVLTGRRKTMDWDLAKISKTYRILSLDIKTGKILWEKNDGVFGTWLSYSEEFDVLLQAYRSSRDMLPEPGDRISARKGIDGVVLWDKSHKYQGPCILNSDTIISQKRAFSLLTGKEKQRHHPLTGELIPWQYSRNYGCNTVIGSTHLLTFRSAAAGYFDLASDGGTGNIGGFKSGCTSNLVVADGVLNAPDYTRTCICSYQNQTSLALIHMPEAEMWTFNKIESSREPVQRIGINLGAPGDRKAQNATLWLDYPSVGGKSPDIPVSTIPKKPDWFRKHSSVVKDGKLKWVAASGAKGLSNIRVSLNTSGNNKKQKQPQKKDRLYTVRLIFLEPDQHIKSGNRLFDVSLRGHKVIENLDIVRETGSDNVSLIREFTGIIINRKLNITLTASKSSLVKETILCGIEIIAEGL